jgi:hypothetical protein
MSADNPIRHHYIPRFMIRPFCYDERHVYYCNKATKIITEQDIYNVFMTRNLYRDEKLHPDNPTKIEKDLARYEQQASDIIKRFREEDEISITAEENESLKLFLAIMGFRADRVRRSFGEHSAPEFRDFYSRYLKKDEDYIELWKRNLGIIVNCRSYEEVKNNSFVDEPFKLFMKRDIVGFSGKYFSVIQSSQDEEFILGDSYPVDMTGVTELGIQMPMYSIFPISPNRTILLAAYGVSNAPRDVLGLKKKSFFQRPTLSADQKLYRIHVGNIDADDVKVINEMIWDASSEGIVLRNSNYMDENSQKRL